MCYELLFYFWTVDIVDLINFDENSTHFTQIILYLERPGMALMINEDDDLVTSRKRENPVF